MFTDDFWPVLVSNDNGYVEGEIMDRINGIEPQTDGSEHTTGTAFKRWGS
jgi:hypothetical protein